jgi:hypothetical protein
MNHKDRPVEPEHINCEVCLKEIPRDEAQSDEATDYIVHFCGLECYQVWKEKQKDEEGA